MNLPPNTSVFKFIRYVTKPFKTLLASQFLISFFWAIDLSLKPYLVKLLLNKVDSYNSSSSAPSLPKQHTLIALWENHLTQDLLMLAILYIAVEGFMALAFRSYDALSMRLYPNLKKHISTLLMEQMNKHSFNFYQNHLSSDLVNKINDIRVNITRILKIFIDQFFGHALALILAIYTLSFTHIKFSLLMFIWASLFLLISLKVAPRAQNLANIAASANSLSVGLIGDILGNILNVRLYNNQNFEIQRLNNALQDTVKQEQHRDWFFLKMHALQMSSFVLLQGLSLWLLIRGFARQEINAGDFTLVITLNISLIECLWYLSSDIREFAEAFGNVAQGLKLLLSPGENKDIPHAKPLVVQKGAIEFKKVKFHYKGTNPLFEDLTITIKPRQRVGLVGYSGSGKSTFVNLILRLYDIHGGTITIDKQDIRQVTAHSLHLAIAMITQDPSLFHRTILENIHYSNLQASKEEVIQAAKEAHAHEFISRLPEGYNSLVGERGIKLSGGERQRLAMARAFLKKAPILILDEATSQLDSLTEQALQETLLKLMVGKTTLIIAHRLATLLHMDRILVFSKGKIVEDGTHTALLAKQGVYHRLWNAQISGFLPDQQGHEPYSQP